MGSLCYVCDAIFVSVVRYNFNTDSVEITFHLTAVELGHNTINPSLVRAFSDAHPIHFSFFQIISYAYVTLC